jgi:hypothetical protein
VAVTAGMQKKIEPLLNARTTAQMVIKRKQNGVNLSNIDKCTNEMHGSRRKIPSKKSHIYIYIFRFILLSRSYARRHNARKQSVVKPDGILL